MDTHHYLVLHQKKSIDHRKPFTCIKFCCRVRKRAKKAGESGILILLFVHSLLHDISPLLFCDLPHEV